ncbi:MAG: aspartate aminotransferase family protein [Desulfobacteraceae bacterium]|nr:MAG: aspartate aminotransferase family protein [Desulfobacteraceae bacterium]
MTVIDLKTQVPGPRSQEIMDRRQKATVSGMALLTPVVISEAKGALIKDVDGNTLLDFAGGIGALAVGHCPDNVVGAMKAQADKLVHTCPLVASYEPFVETVELLNDIAPGDFPKKSALMNSGAEAVETAVKIARSYTGRSAIIVFEGGYHGRTNLTLSMTSKYARFKKGHGPFAPEIYRLPFPSVYRKPDQMDEETYVDFCISQLEHAMVAQVDPSDVACVVIEPVQGEGGYVPTPPRFMQRIRDLCTEHGMLMVADEIQSGFGRTGKLFAIEHYDIVPDLLVTGKSLASGMPLSGVTGSEEIMSSPQPGGMGGTYSGNPLACVAAIETIKTISNPDFLKRATGVGDKIRQNLEVLAGKYDIIGDVRGLGPMLAAELVKDRKNKTPAPETVITLRQEALSRGLIILPSGLYFNCIRFLPPLMISDEMIEEGMRVLDQSFEALMA